MICQLIEHGKKDDKGRSRYKCVNCGSVYNYTFDPPERVKANCPAGNKEGAVKIKYDIKPQSYFTVQELQALFEEENDSELIGNQLKALFQEIGIPPCGGCEQRKMWINQAHLIVRRTIKRILQ